MSIRGNTLHSLRLIEKIEEDFYQMEHRIKILEKRGIVTKDMRKLLDQLEEEIGDLSMEIDMEYQSELEDGQ